MYFLQLLKVTHVQESSTHHNALFVDIYDLAIGIRSYWQLGVLQIHGLLTLKLFCQAILAKIKVLKV